MNLSLIETHADKLSKFETNMSGKQLSFSYAELIRSILTLLSIILAYRLLKKFKGAIIKSQRRFLCKSELAHHQVSLERDGTNNVCLIVSLTSPMKLVRECVFNALVLLAKRQPMLRAVLKTSSSWLPTSDSTDKYFEIIKGDQVYHMIDFKSCQIKSREWKKVWYEITSKLWGTGLLWRAVMLQEEFLPDTQNYRNTIIFNFSHCCVDGVSSVKFCQQFLHYLNNVSEGTCTPDDDITSLDLAPNLTELLKNGQPSSLFKIIVADFLGISHISKFIFKRKLRYSLSSTQNCNPYFAQFPPDMKATATSKSNLISKVFSEAETSKIVKACKLNNCTVTGAIMAATHIIFCKLLQDGYINTKDLQLVHEFCINTQRHCKPKSSNEYLGNYFLPSHPFKMEYTNENGDFWSLARESTKRIHSEVDEGKYVTDNMAVFDSFSIEEIVNEIESPRNREELIGLSMCNSVSSAGCFDFREQQKCHTYQLHECLFNSLIHGLPLAFVHFNATVNGKMSWVILYDPSKFMNVEHAESYANFCFDYFVEIGK